MPKLKDKPVQAIPSATPTEAEIGAWATLSRDDQIRRYQEALSHPDCSIATDDTMKDILEMARRRIAARHG